ncbi:uncharacterized protein LOC135385283 isoform X2 [Ornithodoros turicata]
MKTADYRCEMERAGAHSSCSKLESADQNDIIFHQRGPSAGPINPFVAPPPGAPIVLETPPRQQSPPSPGSLQEQLSGSQGAQPGDVGSMQKQLSSPGSSSDKNVQPKKPSDQSTTETTTLSQEVMGPGPGPEAIAEAALSSDALYAEKPGIRILTTEKITRRQYVYNMEKDGLDECRLDPDRNMAQERWGHEQEPGEHKYYVPPTHDQQKPPEVLQQALDTTIFEDSDTGKVRLNVTCKSSTALHKSGTNVTAPQNQQPPVYSGEYLTGYPPVPERFGEYYPPPGYPAPAPPGYAGSTYYAPPPGYYPQYRPEYYPPQPPPPLTYPAPNYPASPSYRLGPAYWKHPRKRGSKTGPTINTDIIFDINVNKLPSKATKSDDSNGTVSTSSTTTTSSSKAKEKREKKSKSSTSSNTSSGKVTSNNNVKSDSTKPNTTSKTNTNTKVKSTSGYNSQSRSRQKRAVSPLLENNMRRKSNSRSASQVKSNSRSASQVKSSSQPGSNQSIKSNSKQDQRGSNNNSKPNSDQRGSSLCRCGHDSRKCRACEPPVMEEVTE